MNIDYKSIYKARRSIDEMQAQKIFHRFFSNSKNSLTKSGMYSARKMQRKDKRSKENLDMAQAK